MTQSETYRSAFSQLTGQGNRDGEPPEAHETNSVVGAKADDVVLFMSKKSMSCRVDEKMASQAQHAVVGDHIADAAHLSKMELRRRYPREAASHKNMLARRKSKGATVHPAFLEFASFLQHVGPMPTRAATLDRIDNTDPEYAPDKVRWADKRTQNSNKSDTLIFHSTATGETFTAFQLAKRQAVPADTIRKRRSRGWTDDEIIAGTRTSVSSSSPASKARHSRQFPSGLYSPQQMAMLSRPEPQLNHDPDIDFHREAHLHQSYREHEGEEYMVPLYEEWVELMDGDARLIPTREQYEAYFARCWKESRPHIVFQNLSPAQKAMVAKVDPDYVAKQAVKLT